MRNLINVREAHERYEAASEAQRDAVNQAYDAATESLASQGFVIAGDDRAEELVAAIFHYVERCAEA